MADDGFNDNESKSEPPSSPADAHGRAALLLVESLMHGLIARSALSVADAIEIVGIAAEVDETITAERGGPAVASASAKLLHGIGQSLAPDLPSE